MRHQKEGRKLKRTASHRRALLSSLSTALILHKKIQTTTAKAKETRRIIEPIITRARDAWQEEQQGGAVNVHARREVAKFIHDKDAVKILFSEIAEKVGKRPGGYTRVLPLGSRLGDGAEMSVIELVDYNVAQDLKKRKQRVERSKAAQQRRKAADERKAAKGAAPADVVVEDETPAAEGDAPKKKAPRAKAPKDSAPKDTAPADDAPKKKAPRVKAPKDSAPAADAAGADVPAAAAADASDADAAAPDEQPAA